MQAGIGDSRVTQLDPLEMRHPIGQVLQAGVSHSRVEEIERGEAFQSLEVRETGIADAGVVEIKCLEIGEDTEPSQFGVGNLRRDQIDGA